MMTLYVHRQSWLHRQPAGLKLLVLMATSIALYALTSLWTAGAALIAVILAYRSLGSAGWSYLWVVKPLLPMFILIFVVQTWSQSVSAAVLMLLRMLTLIWLANLVTLTTRMDAMMDAVMPLLAPLRRVGVAPHRIAFTVALFVRFVPVLMAVLNSLLEAWKSRGGGRAVWRLAIPMLINAIRMSDHVAQALAARGGVRSPETPVSMVQPQ